MTRAKALGAVLAIGTLTVAVAAQQQARPPLPALQKVKDNLYVITSSTPGAEFTGGNSGVLVTDTGVDNLTRPWVPADVDALLALVNGR